MLEPSLIDNDVLNAGSAMEFNAKNPELTDDANIKTRENAESTDEIELLLNDAITNIIRVRKKSSSSSSSSDDEVVSVHSIHSDIAEINDDEAGIPAAPHVQRTKMNMNRRKIFDSEYYSLPPIEKLNINVKEDVKLEKFGVVDSHIEFIVKIKPMQGVLHLGYETILFDAERNPMGEIFEIFGTVTDTYYALRFNSSEEAADKMPIGKEVFYAPEESVTKPVFPQELARLKNWDRFSRNSADAGESSSEQEFSNDEEEQRYLAKKRQKTRQRMDSASCQSNASRDSAPVKRKKMRTRHDSRSNPFHLQHNQWRQQRMSTGGHGHPQHQCHQNHQAQQQFMPMPPPYAYANPYPQYQHPQQMMMPYYGMPAYMNQQPSHWAQPYQQMFPGASHGAPPPPPPPPPSEQQESQSASANPQQQNMQQQPTTDQSYYQHYPHPPLPPHQQPSNRQFFTNHNYTPQRPANFSMPPQ